MTRRESYNVLTDAWQTLAVNPGAMETCREQCEYCRAEFVADGRGRCRNCGAARPFLTEPFLDSTPRDRIQSTTRQRLVNAMAGMAGYRAMMEKQ